VKMSSKKVVASLKLDDQCILQFDDTVDWSVDDMCFWLQAVNLVHSNINHSIVQIARNRRSINNDELSSWSCVSIIAYQWRSLQRL